VSNITPNWLAVSRPRNNLYTEGTLTSQTLPPYAVIDCAKSLDIQAATLQCGKPVVNQSTTASGGHALADLRALLSSDHRPFVPPARELLFGKTPVHQQIPNAGIATDKRLAKIKAGGGETLH